MATELNGAVYMDHLIKKDAAEKFMAAVGIDPLEVTGFRVEAGIPIQVFVTTVERDDEGQIVKDDDGHRVLKEIEV